MKQEQPLNETRAGCYPAKGETALIWIRAASHHILDLQLILTETGANKNPAEAQCCSDKHFLTDYS
ncbi:hypothetical protein [Aeromonas allosaccharophila]|uniref:hypothetical protein n=1 Tax=Aeromonas allosaccharophila TaxID=656 RepID=UPI003003AE45